MPENKLDRSSAWEVLQQYVTGDTLRKHSLTVEAVMRHFAELRHADNPEKWAVIGLLHDVDFERYPDEHCHRSREILSAYGYPEEYIRAVESHGYGLVCDVEPQSDLEKVLYTIDELTGLIAATALVRPSRSLEDLTVKSVKKKWKQHSFAEGVNREVIEDGAAKLGMKLEDVIAETIAGMRTVAREIGLAG